VCSSGSGHGKAVGSCKRGTRSSKNSINCREISDWPFRKESASFLPDMLLSVVSSFLFVSLLSPFVFTTPDLCECVCVCAMRVKTPPPPPHLSVNTGKCERVILLPSADADAKTN
jgi:hypothetical protein